MQKTTTIEIDLDVFKAIVKHSNYINEPANDVLKRLLTSRESEQLKPMQQVSPTPIGGLTTKGVFLRNGLRLQRFFKGKLFEAQVKDGFIEFNNKRYTSPSGAAVDASNGSVNGWIFWNYFDEQQNSWSPLEQLRRK
jgi:hypothetical protein